MISGRDIVIVSSVDWGFLWQGQHEVASRLARAGNRVLYVENTGVRSLRLGDAPRLASRLGGWMRSLGRRGVREVEPNLYLCSPLVAPPFGPRWRRVINRSALIPLIRRAAAGLEMRDPILWSYLPSDTALDLIGVLRTPRSLVIYTCVADFGELTSRRGRQHEAERSLLQSSDLVFAQGSRLIAHCGRWSSRVASIDCALDLDTFSPPHGPAEPTLAGLPRPVIGYVGGLHRHLDLDLAVAIARARPDWSWVYVGPGEISLDPLVSLPNVRLVGPVPHDGLPRLLRSFDVCTVPYRLGSETDTVFPTKVLEYLAMGKPVVSTRLPALCEFNDEHGVVTTTGPQPDEFLEAIDQALGTNGPLREARRAAAASRDWTAQLERISELIEATARSRVAAAQADTPGADERELLPD